MRLNIEIDDELMKKALEESGLDTKKDAIETGLRLLVQFSRQKSIRKFRGKLKWDCNLNDMRMDP